MSWNLFANYLPSVDLTSVETLCFIERDGAASVAAGYSDHSVFKAVVGSDWPSLFDHIELEGRLYGVDLNSLGTSQVHLYYDKTLTDKAHILGFYVNQGVITGRKAYRKDQGSLLVDYYESDGTPQQLGVAEYWGGDSLWTGDQDILQICKDNNLTYTVSQKPSKNQTYLTVFKE